MYADFTFMITYMHLTPKTGLLLGGDDDDDEDDDDDDDDE